MRVLFVHHCGGYGGSCRSLGILLPELQRLGVEPHVVTPPGTAADYFSTISSNVTVVSPSGLPCRMTVVSMKRNRYQFFKNVASHRDLAPIRNIIRTVNPDIVHLNEWGLFPIAPVATAEGCRVTIHARTMPDPHCRLLNHYAISEINRLCDHMFCISGSVCRAMSKVRDKSTLYNPAKMKPNSPEVQPRQTVNFLSLSALRESKGIYDIVEAAKLLQDDQRIRILVGGSLEIPEASQRTLRQKVLGKLGLFEFDAVRLRQQIEQHNLTNVQLLGHVSNVDRAIAASDVILAPMHLNAPPRSVYEGAMRGLPSILSMKDKVEDVVEHDATGLLINERSPQELAHAIRSLANSPELRSRMGHLARERSAIRHDPSRLAAQVAERYEQLHGAKPQQQRIAA